MNPCGRCGYETETYLCEICSAATIRALALVSSLVGDLRAAMTDLHAQPLEGRVDGTRDMKLGADFDLSDRAHALYSRVADWVLSWAPITGRAMPSFMDGWDPKAATVTRIPSGLVATKAAGTVASWLIGEHDSIIEHPDAPRYALDVIDAVSAEARVIGYRPRPRPVPRKLCRVCRAAKLRVFWPIDGDPTLRCQACGGEWPCGPALSRQIFVRS